MSEPAARVVLAGPDHVAPWSELRAALWPDATATEHRRDIEDMLPAPETKAAFLVVAPSGATFALAEASIRTDYVNGCGDPPVAFLEGIYVAPAFRRQGWAARLVADVEGWARARGCRELASDADVVNLASHRAHARWGFQETERVVFFRKALSPSASSSPESDELS